MIAPQEALGGQKGLGNLALLSAFKRLGLDSSPAPPPLDPGRRRGRPRRPAAHALPPAPVRRDTLRAPGLGGFRAIRSKTEQISHVFHVLFTNFELILLDFHHFSSKFQALLQAFDEDLRAFELDFDGFARCPRRLARAGRQRSSSHLAASLEAWKRGPRPAATSVLSGVDLFRPRHRSKSIGNPLEID